MAEISKGIFSVVNTYLYEKRLAKDSSPEDNLNCPLRIMRLGRIGPKTYRLNYVDRRSLHPLIVYYAMVYRSERIGDSANHSFA